MIASDTVTGCTMKLKFRFISLKDIDLFMILCKWQFRDKDEKKQE